MIKTKVAFLEGRLFSNQSGLFKNFLVCSDDWLDKSRPSKKDSFVLIIKSTNNVSFADKEINIITVFRLIGSIEF